MLSIGACRMCVCDRFASIPPMPPRKLPARVVFVAPPAHEDVDLVYSLIMLRSMTVAEIIAEAVDMTPAHELADEEHKWMRWWMAIQWLTAGKWTNGSARLQSAALASEQDESNVFVVHPWN